MEQGFVECNSSNLPKLDFNMIYEFMINENANEAAGTSKEERSARPTYGDKAIGKVQLKRDGSTCVVKARITPEHSIRKSAYNVTCTVDEVGKKIIHAQCEDCPEGGCKHRVAFIMWLHRRSEEPSPTEVTSYWKRSVLSEAGLQPLAIQSISNRQEEQQNLPSTSQIENFKSMVHEECSSKVVLSYFSGNVTDADNMKVLDIHKMIQGCTSYQGFVAKMKSQLTGATICKIEAVTREQASSPAWHLAHYGRVTASKFHSVAQCKTEDGSLLNAILGEKIKSNKAMERGSRLEKEIFNVLRKKFPTLKKCGLFLHKEYPLFGASPDGITENAVFEIKCPSSLSTVTNYLKDGRINIKYQLQIQMQMAMCNVKK
ncbi:hypothetical protein WDU94_010817 [Cyamophila willieti]